MTAPMIVIIILLLVIIFLIGSYIDHQRVYNRIVDYKSKQVEPPPRKEDLKVRIEESDQEPPKQRRTHAERMEAFEREFRVKYADGKLYNP